MLLKGTFQNSIDAKGRMNIPAKLRTKLGDSVVLAKGYDDCLYIFAEEEFEVYVGEHIRNRPEEDDDARLLRAFFLGNSWDCDVDKQGRINLPADYIEFAGIEKEITCIGLGDRIGVWAKGRYEEMMRGSEMNPKKLIASMGKYVQ
ncbi:MAG: division/cell wall cluster transcriptional repressor MraZ [Clostridiales Family XIII bacterium]|jgi:MraZ protein|nr:division/cell wall cluster transcriptional repressor MraZ [Clostridiales Family XIII bacterium]